jgi:hypothetical protein
LDRSILSDTLFLLDPVKIWYGERQKFYPVVLGVEFFSHFGRTFYQQNNGTLRYTMVLSKKFYLVPGTRHVYLVNTVEYDSYDLYGCTWCTDV